MSTLYIVATPIGNLKDITLRAIETLKLVDVIACEDTRVTRKLLNYYGIKGKKLISYHEYNEEKIAEKIIDLIKKNQKVALVSDAGTPCISDPGYKLVNLAWKNKIKIEPIPGAFAGIVALSSSGLPTDKFIFAGFPPNKEKRREKFLTELMQIGYTFVIYESPKRLLKTLKTIADISSESVVFVAKELTKIHEKFIRGSIDEVYHFFINNKNLIKGEFVIVVYPHIKKEIDLQIVENEIVKMLNEGKKTKEIAKELSQKFKFPQNYVYKLVIEVQKEFSK